MNELIKITTNSHGGDVVSARNLHNFFQSAERFSKWFDRMKDYGLIENQDFSPVLFGTHQNQHGGEKDLQDYALTIDCAKHISMLQRTEKGKQARQYFIDRDNQLREIELTQKDYVLKKLQEFEDFKKDILSGKSQNYLIKKNKVIENSTIAYYLDKYLVKMPKEKREGLTCTEITAKINEITNNNFSLKIIGNQLAKKFDKLQINQKGINRKIYFVNFS